MTIDNSLISKLENLARLELSPEEKEEFSSDLSKILDMVEKLKEVNTVGIQPLIYMTEHPTGIRKDGINHQLKMEEVLRNAPDYEGPYFKTPKVK